MENTALTNATRASPQTAGDIQLCTDSELDASMIIDKIQHLVSRLKIASDKLEKPFNMCGKMSVKCLNYPWLTVKDFFQLQFNFRRKEKIFILVKVMCTELDSVKFHKGM